MWNVSGTRLRMSEHDFGLSLPVTVHGAELTAVDSLRFTFNQWEPVYITATPQADGSAILDYFTQSKPTTNDGKIYIYLGIAVSETTVEMSVNHPVYYHNGTGIRLWTGGN